MHHNNEFTENFFLIVIVMFWGLIPAVMGIFLFHFFNKQTKSYLYHDNETKKYKWCTKWGFKRGKPYIKDRGWGPNFSKLDWNDYLIELEKERKNENG